MERRTMLTGLMAGAAGTALAAASARAQSTAPAASAPAAKADMPASGMSEAVQTHIRDTMAVGGQSLLISRVALTKLKHPMGRQFADFETAEQNGIADVLKSRMTPDAKPTGTIAAPSDADVEAALDPDGKAAVAKFRDMAAGPEFEKAYVQAEIDGHKKLLGIQDTYLGVADNDTATDLAKLIKGRVQEHLVILGDIEKHLG